MILTDRGGRRPTGHSVLVRVEDADAHDARAVAAGARIVSPPETYEFGERQYTVEDPNGHVWAFSESVADIDPATWGGVLEPEGLPTSSAAACA